MKEWTPQLKYRKEDTEPKPNFGVLVSPEGGATVKDLKEKNEALEAFIKESVVKLIPILEKLDPDKFGPDFLSKNLRTIYKKLLKDLLKNKEGKPDWMPFDSQLPEKWQERFYIPEKRLKFIVAKFVPILEKEKPEYFTPRSIKNMDPGTYSILARILPKDKENNIDYKSFEEELPDEWKNKFEYGNISFPYIVLKFVLFLEKENPKNFSVSYMRKYAPGITSFLERNLPKNEKKNPDWQYFISQLPEKWQERFTYREREHLSLEECVSRVVEELNKKKPEQFGPFWIQDNCGYIVYEELCRILRRDKNGNIVWKIFVDALPKEWQAKWKHKMDPYYKHLKEFPSKKELRQILLKYKNYGDEHENKLYTLPYYPDISKDDRKIANELVGEIIKLAQKGSSAAREMLEMDLNFVCEDWIEKYPGYPHELKPWKNKPEQLRKLIRGCIYNYKDKGQFFSYLFATLKMSKPASIIHVEFDEGYMKKMDDAMMEGFEE
ncbi:MAG: hypothetical protein V4439_02700 [Patescibacteria group bacterium]